MSGGCASSCSSFLKTSCVRLSKQGPRQQRLRLGFMKSRRNSMEAAAVPVSTAFTKAKKPVGLRTRRMIRQAYAPFARRSMARLRRITAPAVAPISSHILFSRGDVSSSRFSSSFSVCSNCPLPSFVKSPKRDPDPGAAGSCKEALSRASFSTADIFPSRRLIELRQARH